MEAKWWIKVKQSLCTMEARSFILERVKNTAEADLSMRYWRRNEIKTLDYSILKLLRLIDRSRLGALIMWWAHTLSNKKMKREMRDTPHTRAAHTRRSKINEKQQTIIKRVTRTSPPTEVTCCHPLRTADNNTSLHTVPWGLGYHVHMLLRYIYYIHILDEKDTGSTSIEERE